MYKLSPAGHWIIHQQIPAFAAQTIVVFHSVSFSGLAFLLDSTKFIDADAHDLLIHVFNTESQTFQFKTSALIQGATNVQTFTLSDKGMTGQNRFMY